MCLRCHIWSLCILMSAKEKYTKCWNYLFYWNFFRLLFHVERLVYREPTSVGFMCVISQLCWCFPLPLRTRRVQIVYRPNPNLFIICIIHLNYILELRRQEVAYSLISQTGIYSHFCMSVIVVTGPLGKLVFCCNQITHEIPLSVRSAFGVFFICRNCNLNQKLRYFVSLDVPQGFVLDPLKMFHSVQRSNKFPTDSLLPTADLLIRAVLISGPSLFQLCSLHHWVMLIITFMQK